MNFFSIAAKGGYLMILLVLLSLLVIAVIIEQWLRISRIRKNTSNLLGSIASSMANNSLDNTHSVCSEHDYIPIARVIIKGLKAMELGFAEVKRVIETSVNLEIHLLEKKLGILATISAVAPLIGFLGTVTGMVKVFMKISALGGGVDIGLLAGGIWEALITTIGGLAVGIIGILFYNFFVGKIEELSFELTSQADDFITELRKLK